MVVYVEYESLFYISVFWRLIENDIIILWLIQYMYIYIVYMSLCQKKHNIQLGLRNVLFGLILVSVLYKLVIGLVSMIGAQNCGQASASDHQNAKIVKKTEAALTVVLWFRNHFRLKQMSPCTTLLLHDSNIRGSRKKVKRARDTTLQGATTLFEIQYPNSHGKFFGRCGILCARNFWEDINKQLS